MLSDEEYEFSFYDIQFGFDDAEAFCNEIRGRLIEPVDVYMMNNVTDYANMKSIGSFWLGIHDKYDEGTFVFASSNFTIVLSNWAAGQPDNNSTGEDCVEVNENGQWNDLPCEGRKKSFVCMRGNDYWS